MLEDRPRRQRIARKAPWRQCPGSRTISIVLAAIQLAWLGAVLAAPASARSLGWEALEVEARLDADGRLHVVERHTMVFDGAWNGGERQFVRQPFQRLRVESVVRIDPETGAEILLRKGDLDKVDRWNWAEQDVLRWRSRRPDDPPFDDQVLIYELHYRLAPVLLATDEGYRFDHDFASADRAGSIDRYTLDLTLDPAWKKRDHLPDHVFRTDVRPGESAMLTAMLDHVGDAAPGAVLAPLPRRAAVGGLIASLVGILGFWLALWPHERARGRFDDPDVPEQVDRAFLETHLLDLSPEEVGALWDRKVGPPEVAAVLARMVAEGKLESEVRGKGRGKVLVLRRKVLPIELTGYERKLCDKLFFGGRTETDTKAIRKHYKKKGFDPAALLRSPLAAQIRRKVDRGPEPEVARDRSALWLGLAAAVALAVQAFVRPHSALVILAMLLFSGLVTITTGSIFVAVYRKRVRRLVLWSLGFLIPALVMALVFFWPVVGRFADFYPTWSGLVAMVLLTWTLMAAWRALARTRESSAAIARRQVLGALRDRLRDELGREQPELDDVWLPYLIAFGLDKQVDRWFRQFGAVSTVSHAHVGSSLSGGSSGGSLGSRSWTGGGGSFGGAGAMAAWSSAATSLGAGVSAASSGGSSGGGGGSSFSGGGGGGGW